MLYYGKLIRNTDQINLYPFHCSPNINKSMPNQKGDFLRVSHGYSKGRCIPLWDTLQKLDHFYPNYNWLDHKWLHHRKINTSSLATREKQLHHRNTILNSRLQSKKGLSWRGIMTVSKPLLRRGNKANNFIVAWEIPAFHRGKRSCWLLNPSLRLMAETEVCLQGDEQEREWIKPMWNLVVGVFCCGIRHL